MLAPLRYITSISKRSKLTIINIGIVIMFITATLITVYSFEMSNRDLVKRFESKYYIISSQDDLLQSHVPLNLVTNGTYIWLFKGEMNNESTYIVGIYDESNILGWAYQCSPSEVILGKGNENIKGYVNLEISNVSMNLKVKRYLDFKFFPNYWCIVNYTLLKNMSEPNFVIVDKNINIPGYQIRGMTSLTQFYSKTAEEISFDLILMDLISIVVIYLFVNALLTMEIRENTKNIAIIKAIGSTKFNIGGIYFLRSIYIGFIGMLVGFSLGVVLSYLLSAVIPLFGMLTYFNIYIPPLVIIADFLIAVIGSAVASITPIKKAVKINIIRGIRGVRA